MAAFFALASPWLELAVGAYWLAAGLASGALFAALGPASERIAAPRLESVLTKRLLHLAFGGVLLPLALACIAATWIAGTLGPWLWRKAVPARGAE